LQYYYRKLVSVSENEIVCYIVGNAITNAKVRGPGHTLASSNY